MHLPAGHWFMRCSSCPGGVAGAPPAAASAQALPPRLLLLGCTASCSRRLLASDACGWEDL